MGLTLSQRDSVGQPPGRSHSVLRKPGWGWSTHTGPRGGRRWRGWRFSHRAMRDGLSEKVTREKKPEGSGRARRGAWRSVQAEGSIARVACLLQGATYTPKPETPPQAKGVGDSTVQAARSSCGPRRNEAGASRWAPGAQCNLGGDPGGLGARWRAGEAERLSRGSGWEEDAAFVSSWSEGRSWDPEVRELVMS